MIELMGVNLSHDVFITTRDGVRIPIHIEELESNIFKCYPEIRCSIIGKPSRMPDRNKPVIKEVIFNDPATIVIWSDNTKTVVKCQEGDTYSKELGLAMCISKKFLGNKGNFNEEFKKWIPEEPEPVKTDLENSFSKLGKALHDAFNKKEEK